MKRRQGRMAESEFRGIQIQANRHFTRRPSVEVFKDCMRNSQPCLFFVILKAYKGRRIQVASAQDEQRGGKWTHAAVRRLR